MVAPPRRPRPDGAALLAREPRRRAPRAAARFSQRRLRRGDGERELERAGANVLGGEGELWATLPTADGGARSRGVWMRQLALGAAFAVATVLCRCALRARGS